MQTLEVNITNWIPFCMLILTDTLHNIVSIFWSCFLDSNLYASNRRNILKVLMLADMFQGSPSRLIMWANICRESTCQVDIPWFRKSIDGNQGVVLYRILQWQPIHTYYEPLFFFYFLLYVKWRHSSQLLLYLLRSISWHVSKQFIPGLYSQSAWQRTTNTHTDIREFNWLQNWQLEIVLKESTSFVFD